MDQTYPIAEIFESPQGEGTFSGALMTFIRLAGCNVGRPYTTAAREQLGLNVYQERCSDWAGVGFSCDTNYKVSRRLTIEEILAIPEVQQAQRILITGGEPFIHDLEPLCRGLLKHGVGKLHFETSGTKDFKEMLFKLTHGPDGFMYSKFWICVSPKKDYIPELLDVADEIKVLIGDSFEEDKFIAQFVFAQNWYKAGKVFISPVNDEHSLNKANADRCLALQRKYPLLRLTLQSHKIWGVR